jgi:hypothetical protein
MKVKMDQDTRVYKKKRDFFFRFCSFPMAKRVFSAMAHLIEVPVSAHSLFNFINSASKLLSRCHTTGGGGGGGGAGAVFRIEDIFLLNHFFEGTFTSFFTDKKSERSHKTVGITVFLTIFA